jgi:hypothetical protein
MKTKRESARTLSIYPCAQTHTLKMIGSRNRKTKEGSTSQGSGMAEQLQNNFLTLLGKQCHLKGLSQFPLEAPAQTTMQAN